MGKPRLEAAAWPVEFTRTLEANALLRALAGADAFGDDGEPSPDDPRDFELEAGDELFDFRNYAGAFHRIKWPDPRLDPQRARVAALAELLWGELRGLRRYRLELEHRDLVARGGAA